jgi:hypothetical protein
MTAKADLVFLRVPDCGARLRRSIVQFGVAVDRVVGFAAAGIAP